MYCITSLLALTKKISSSGIRALLVKLLSCKIWVSGLGEDLNVSATVINYFLYFPI